MSLKASKRWLFCSDILYPRASRLDLLPAADAHRPWSRAATRLLSLPLPWTLLQQHWLPGQGSELSPDSAVGPQGQGRSTKNWCGLYLQRLQLMPVGYHCSHSLPLYNHISFPTVCLVALNSSIRRQDDSLPRLYEQLLQLYATKSVPVTNVRIIEIKIIHSHIHRHQTSNWLFLRLSHDQYNTRSRWTVLN